MDEELARKLDLLTKYAESIDAYLNSIRKMLKFFVVLTVTTILIYFVGMLLR